MEKINVDSGNFTERDKVMLNAGYGEGYVKGVLLGMTGAVLGILSGKYIVPVIENAAKNRIEAHRAKKQQKAAKKLIEEATNDEFTLED